MPFARLKTVSASDLYRMRASVKEIKPLVDGAFEDIVSALTRPLTPEEATPPQLQKEALETEITVKAESYPGAMEQFNQVFLEKRWGDGLPLVPPTRERVDWMLSGTSRSRNEVIGKIDPKLGIATIEKIAINAVMAGARPEYLPVIISAIEALSDDSFDDLHVLASAGSFTLIIVVSGAIAKELNMNSGIGFLGHGFRANNTIGRAIRLSTLNIGRLWPGENDMALTGRISSHTFYTFAENADLSPWQPYHAGRGFRAEDSCVTIASIGSSGPMQNFYGGLIGTWNAKTILDNLVGNIVRADRTMISQWGNRGVGLIPGSGQGAKNHFVVLFPALAAELHRMGFNQQRLQEEVYGRAVIRYEELSPADRRAVQTAIDMGVIPADRKPVFEKALQPGGMVPVLISPDNLHFFVAGGVPGCAFSFSYYRLPPYKPTAVMTRLVTGATMTAAGKTDESHVPYGA